MITAIDPSAENRRKSVLFAQLLLELLRGDFDLTQNFSDERAGKVSSRMVRKCCRSTVGMTVKDVAPSLTNSPKTKVEEHPFHLPKPYGRETAHTATSTC